MLHVPSRKEIRQVARQEPFGLKKAAVQVAVDAEQVRQDLGKLLLSLEDLSVEALKEVSDRAFELIAERPSLEYFILVIVCTIYFPDYALPSVTKHLVAG